MAKNSNIEMDLDKILEELAKISGLKIVYIFHNGKEVLDYGDHEFNL